MGISDKYEAHNKNRLQLITAVLNWDVGLIKDEDLKKEIKNFKESLKTTVFNHPTPQHLRNTNPYFWPSNVDSANRTTWTIEYYEPPSEELDESIS